VLIRNAEVEIAGRRERADLSIEGGRIARIGRGLAASPDEPAIEAHGAALLPALHDHHLHLLALAASMRSVACGPPDVCGPEALAAALHADAARSARGPEAWVRGVGYHESVAGELDRAVLDRLAPGRRVRIQHRSGAAWLLSTPALEALGITADAPDLPPGVERDGRGRPTGRLFRLDQWLRDRLPETEAPSLAESSRVLAAAGVAGVTDATPGNDATTVALLAREQAAGALLQRVVLMGGEALDEGPADPGPDGALACGALKVVLDERDLPAPEVLTERIARAHGGGRPVAIHCVTRTELVLAAHALEAAGALPHDRIEHASIAPPELVDWLARLGVCVVTQPGFVFERGDRYLRDVEASDRPWLYRCRAFEAAGVPLGAGTDAPYSAPDPWRAVRAAVDRRTRDGATLGGGEALSPERALALFTTAPDAPGGPPRRIAPGEPADVVLLDRPWQAARDRLVQDDVRFTIGAGRILWSRDAGAVADA
jgi:predicted amidohydrolase YtcJ